MGHLINLIVDEIVTMILNMKLLRFSLIVFLHICTLSVGTVVTTTNIPTFTWQQKPFNASFFTLKVSVFPADAQNACVWDTGTLFREQQKGYNWENAITYSGPALQKNTSYSWRARMNGQDVGAGTVITSSSLKPAKWEALSAVTSPESPNITSLFEGTLASLRGRINQTDGYMNTSVGGGYTGLYTRDTSAAVNSPEWI